MTERTVLDLYRHELDAPRPDHYSHVTPAGRRVLSTEQYFARTAALASGLDALGVRRGDRVLLLSDNRPEWHMVDLAVVDLGAADVPLYGTLTPAQVAYQAKDSGAVAAVVESPEQMAKLLAIRGECPELKHLIQIEGDTAPGVINLAEVVARGESGDAQDLFWQRAAKVSGEDLLTLIYTSGTTGNPKGVCLTHSNLVDNVRPSAERAPIGREDLALEFLPLCHVFERMLGYLYMYRAVSRAYCSVYHVGDLIAGIHPTVFAGVPRFYEKVYDKIMLKVNASSPVRRGLATWALGVGERVYPLRLEGRQASGLLGLQHRLADRLVLAKVRDALGGRVRFCISGGAPLPLFVNQLFQSVGIWILEGYGLTETSPVIAVNGASPGKTRLGTVGLPLENLEVRIAGDGELLVRGPSVMKGYWNLPERTAEVFDGEGFFATGDIAEVDGEGFVRITDRKKDLIVTAGGKNVAPQAIESELKRSPLVDNAVLIGDRRPFIVALLSPNEEELRRWATEHGLAAADLADLTREPRVRALYQGVVDAVNAGLARYEQVRAFAVLPLMLSIESGFLTPTLKVKRRVVEREYAELIDGLYRE